MAYQLLGNFISSLNLLFGLLSIIFSGRGNFILSGWLIILAIFLDIIGEKITLLSKKSEFSREFDSLADFISFGIAPVILIYKNFEKFHFWWISILFLYLVCSAIRLARFNIYTKRMIPSYFRGLPITVSGGLMAVTVILIQRYSMELKLQTLGILISILSLLMVSKIKYPNFQDLENKRAILFLVIGLILLNILGESFIWFIFLGYIIGSPFLLRVKLTKKVRSDRI